RFWLMQLNVYRSRQRVSSLAVALLFAAGAAVLHAQDNATISGSVLDVAGKGIPGAAVSARNDSTGTLKMIATDTEGKYTFSNLADGVYTVEASAPSFTSSKRSAIKVAKGGTETINLSLNVGELAQSITVEGTVSVAAET